MVYQWILKQWNITQPPKALTQATVGMSLDIVGERMRSVPKQILLSGLLAL